MSNGNKAPLQLLGRTFHRLTVVERAANGKNNESRWRCTCSCGGERVVKGSSLVSGTTKSCGCWLREHTKHVDTARHGHSRRKGKTPEYECWNNMRRRCSDPSIKDWPAYGGRGIRVCERWESFAAFIADMGIRPTPAHTIERIDVNGNYEPGNCCWIPREEQARNKRPRNEHRIPHLPAPPRRAK